MRVRSPPLPLALTVVALLSSFRSTLCTASPDSPDSLAVHHSTSHAARLPLLLAEKSGFARIRRQDTGTATGAAGTMPAAGQGPGSGTGETSATTPGEQTPPVTGTPTTTQAQQSTTPAGTTSQTTGAPAQTTSDAQQTSSPTTTTQPTATSPTGQAPTSATPTSSTLTTPGPASSPTSGTATQPTTSTTSASAPSSASSASSQKSSSITLSDVTSTYTSTFTNSDGSVGTSTGMHVTQSAVPIKNNSSSSSTGKTWGIIGGVVGGVIVVAALVFIAYRMTQKRFSSIDNDDIDEFKWPDLQPDGQSISANTSTLKPLDTHRAQGSHGIGDDGDLASEYGGGPAGDIRSTGALYAPADGADPRGGYADPYASHSRQASHEMLAMIDGGAAAYSQGYDPYLGGGAIHAPVAPYGEPAGMVYPPSPPQYRSPGSSPYGVQGAFPAGEQAHSAGAGPQGAPGAGGAFRAQSLAASFETGLPRIERSESPFAVPGYRAASSIGHADEEKGERRGPL